MERNNASRPNSRPSNRPTGNKSKSRTSSGDGKQFGKDKPFTGNKSRQSGFPKTGFRSGSSTGRTGVASAPRSARPAKAIPVPVVPKVSDGKERINVALRNTGKATRREADELIEGGKVYVNGVKATLGMRVLPTDKIELRGKGKDYRYFLYNKPAGIVTTQPQPGEKDIVSTSKFPTKVFPIGRLDKESTGLLILTNDGRITDDMLSPEKDHEKEYIVSVDKMVTRIFKEKMEKGVLIGGDLKMDQYKTRPCKVNLIGEKSFSIILTEGKNRQIRRMTEALGFKVMKLERIRIGKFMIGKLKPGEWREVKI